MTHLIQLHEFQGGIHPAEQKHLSNQTEIQIAPLADELVLPLNQHIGAPATPVVSVGDKVLKGQMLAKPQGFVSASIHAPTSGTITAIEPRSVPHASGLKETCLVLAVDHQDEWCEHQSLFEEKGVDDLTDLSPEDLVERIRNSGIAGMGGAGFPTSVKLAIKRDEQGTSPIHTLILNGAECEPYITADDRLMRERADSVVRGAQILMQIVSAKRCLIGVEDNKPEAIQALEQALVALHEEHHIDVVSIPTKYPSGGEKQLIQILTGEEVPSGGIPAQLGIVCQNVGTAAAIAQAIYEGKPLISRVTTVTGQAVDQPGNWEVALGTPVSHLLSLAGYQEKANSRVIMGGPMMGFTLPSTDLPLTKTSNCLLVPTADELPLNEAAMACIRCGLCTQACPAQLLPQQLYWFSKAQEFDKAEQHNLFDCIECGACSYVCPSEIPLVQYYRFAKGSIREERAAQSKSDKARERFERRLARQEKEAAEKEAKRKARAEAAAKAAAEKKANADKADSAESPSAGSSTGATTSPELEKLQKQLSASQTAQEKTKAKLSEAKQALEAGDESQAVKVTAFEAALEKTQAKIKDLAKAIAAEKKALKAAPAAGVADKGDPNSPERLKRKWETALARLETAQKRLADAKENSPDIVANLEEGIAKQQARVDEAKAAYEAALSNDSNSSTDSANSTSPDGSAKTPSATESDSVDLDALKKKLLAQQDRLQKAQERLNMAEEQQLDTVDALKKGVDKQQQKLEELQKQILQAEQSIKEGAN